MTLPTLRYTAAGGHFLHEESPTISMRKPGKKHNRIRLQCNTPKKKLLHTVKN